MKYGYVRVSTDQQHIDRQVDALIGNCKTIFK